MQISYELSERDFVEGSRIHRDRTAFSRWSRRVFIAIIILAGCAFCVTVIMDPAERTPSTLLPMCVLVVFWIAIVWRFPQWSMRRQFRKQPAAHGPRAVTLGPDGAHWRWDGGSADVAWKNYIRWIEGTNQILLYTSPACFGVLPTRGLQPAQLAELRDVLKRNIQSGK